VCNEWLHFLPSTGIAKGYDCFFKWHDEAFFGLGRMNSVCIFNKRKKDWTPPNRTVKQRNKRHINNLKNDENDSSSEDDSSNMKWIRISRINYMIFVLPSYSGSTVVRKCY
jgi:hypothetical protein